MNNACREFQSIGRRDILRIGAAGFAGLTLPNLLRASPAGPRARAKHVIFLHQFGGPSHIDTFDMKPGAPEQVRGEFSPIGSIVPGVPVTEHLPRFSKVLDRFAQVRSVHHGMRNHNSAGYYSLTGHKPPLDDIRLRDTQELCPAYGSTVARFQPNPDPAIPTFVSFPHRLSDGSTTPGQTASFLGKPYDPFFIGQDPNDRHFSLPELTLPDALPMGRLDDRRAGAAHSPPQPRPAVGNSATSMGS